MRSYTDYKIEITIIGAGYVGLVSSACFAELGFKVICIDKDSHKIKNLKNGNVPIYEPTLEQLIKKNLKSERLAFSDCLSEATLNSHIIFIAVGTPIKEDGNADLSEVEMAVKKIAPLLHNHKVIVIKSTVPVGTCQRLQDSIKEINCNAKFDIVSNPEFLRAGSGIKDFMFPDRIVIGLTNGLTRTLMSNLYQGITEKGIPTLYTSLENAELIKYVSNCFLATKIAFTNEVSDLCEKLGTDITDVLYGMGLDNRIGQDYLQPGPGFGGSCLAKDAQSLIKIAESAGSPLNILRSALHSNFQRKKRIKQIIIEACQYPIAGMRLAILGVSFKANTDDIRESIAVSLIPELQALGAKIIIYDPIVQKNNLFVDVEWGTDVYNTLQGADAAIIITEWDAFRYLDMKKVKSSLRNTVMEPTLIDLRNLYTPAIMAKSGIRYVSVGRTTIEAAHTDLAKTS